MDDSELDRILKSWDFRSLLNLKLDEHLYGIINELLCNYSKEYTSIRKLNEAIQDTFNAFNSKLAESAVDMGLGYFDATYSSVGSRGEGLGLLANDTDLLCVSNRTKVCLPMPDFDPDINTLIMEMDHCHQGYCKLKLHRNNLFDAVDNLPRSEIVRKHRNIYVKNTHFVGRFHDKNVAFHGWYWEGPALKDYDTKQDWVIALQCMNSSHLYKAYFQRTRRWPNVDMTEHMKNIPCSVVCAHHASSDAPLEEYRISFARAEKYIMRNVSHVQMACYFTLKEVVKNHVEDILSDDFDEDENDIFKTYYIKTVFLWCSERTNLKFGRTTIFSDAQFYVYLIFSSVMNCK
ncbi:unnamed protein product [Mytilus coruscus]|uniref:Uncharacterized protein n=1 Tax=Mytilus coruscus TaxID=42192 RepID=A0A6J8ERK4_MYTCO|nr:unnamed protein product [Mytilus coruscus]